MVNLYKAFPKPSTYHYLHSFEKRNLSTFQSINQTKDSFKKLFYYSKVALFKSKN